PATADRGGRGTGRTDRPARPQGDLGAVHRPELMRLGRSVARTRRKAAEQAKAREPCGLPGRCAQGNYSKISPLAALSTSDCGGSKCGPYLAASSRARSTKPCSPPGYWFMNCTTPPVHAGKPMPKIEPMLASATVLITPSSKHRTVSTAWENRNRSFRSSNGTSPDPESNASRSPGHRPTRLPSRYS